MPTAQYTHKPQIEINSRSTDRLYLWYMQEGKEQKKNGRPSLYTDELGEAICEQIATSSKSMKTICEEKKISLATVLTWLSSGHRNHIEKFAKLYALAKEMQADYLAEEILEIADDGSNDYMTITKGDTEYNVEDREVTNRSKLRVDARKWVASKLKPWKFGDKIDVTSGGEKLPTGAPEIRVYNSGPPLSNSEAEVDANKEKL